MFQPTPIAAVALSLLAAATAAPALAQSAAPPLLLPPAQRISDEAIATDQQAYEQMQGRLKALNDGGRPVRDYGLSKAQCWLDVSFHEYTRNDRSAFPEQALAQAGALARRMEAGAAVGWETPLVNDAQRLRPDLWARAAQLRKHEGWACAQQKAACAEVELVHAGNEQQQLQWRHAKPYVQIAEDLVAEAELLAQRCVPPPVAVAAAPVVTTVPVPVPLPVVPVVVPAPLQQVQLSASVVFNFDRHTPTDMRPYSVAQLQALVAQVQRDGLSVRSLVLIGHADRLNGTGHSDYNQRLSEQRVATVRAALDRLGLKAVAVSSRALGDGQQVQACSGHFKSPAELQECLLPNRRVEVQIWAERAAR